MKKKIALVLLAVLMFGACVSHQGKGDYFEQMKEETLSQKLSVAEEEGYSVILVTEYDEGGEVQGYQLSVYIGETELENGSFDENQTMGDWRKMKYDAQGKLLSEYVIVEGIEKDGGKNRAIRRYTYDKNGNRLSYCLYKVSEDGTEHLSLKEEYGYDADGKKISSTGYEIIDGEEEIQFNSEFVYDTSDMIIEKTTYYFEGEAYILSVYHYDEKNQKVFEKSGRILDQGEISEYNESTGWSYDDNGNLLKEERFVNSDVVSYITYVYEFKEYSESCNWYEGSPNKDEVFKGGYVCEYNEKGELCKRTEYNEDKTETSVTYDYDEFGRVVKQCEYKNGKCLRYFDYEYR